MKYSCKRVKRVLATTAVFMLTSSLTAADYLRPETVTGPAQVIEAEVYDVAKNFNNSRSTPLARHDDYLYWAYVATDNPDNPTNYFVHLHQISLPEQRAAGPYPKVSYAFTNSYGSAGHQLRVLDGSVGSLDSAHTAPSVGVDAEGYIHVLGGSHHSRWEYCVSTYPNNISQFECPTTSYLSERLPPNDRPTYARFIKHTDGRLYLTYRGRFSTHWHNGTSYGALAVYDEATQRWQALGDDNYQLGDLLLQNEPESSYDSSSGIFRLPIDPKWLPGGSDLPETQKGLFYSDTGAYHRYYRNPINGDLADNYSGFGNGRYAYQAYWTDMKVAPNGRIHVAVVARQSSIYDATETGADALSTRTVQSSSTGESYTYDEKTFVENYDFASSIIYAYSDDGGETFFAPNGEQLDAPISPEPLTPLYGSSELASASFGNGSIVYRDNSATVETNLYTKIEISLQRSGKPVIQFRESASDGSGNYTMKAMAWNGCNWETVDFFNRISGAAGGLVSDAKGGLWAFESVNANADVIPSSPASSGNTVLYSQYGIYGPWTEIDADWRNGIRFDSYSAATSNVMRYVDMDIQRAGTSRIVSLIPPQDADSDD